MKYLRHKNQHYKRNANKNIPDLQYEKETVTALSLATDGRAIARSSNGTIIFVENMLPSETAVVNITQKKNTFKSAVMHKLEQESPDRVVPPCPYYAECGGCTLQHLNPDLQTEYKIKWLFETLTRIGKWKSEHLFQAQKIISIIYLKNWNYRRRIKLNYNGNILGYRQKSTHKIVDIQRCDIASEKINIEISNLRTTISDAALIMKKDLGLKKLEFDISLTLSDQEKIILNLENIEVEPTSLKNNCEVLLKRKLKLDNKQLIDIDHPDINRFKLKKNSFVQPHKDAVFSYYFHIKTSLNDYITNLIKKNEPAYKKRTFKSVDLFCGSGVFTSIPYFLGKALDINISVTGVEGISDAIESMTLNHKNLPIQGECCDVYEFLQKSFKSISLGLEDPYDIVILDPPRSGFGLAAMQQLIEICDKRCFVAFLACDPASFARDSRLFYDSGFKLTQFKLFDAFAQTTHYELLACFER